jgi:hypothetical protein
MPIVVVDLLQTEKTVGALKGAPISEDCLTEGYNGFIYAFRLANSVLVPETMKGQTGED